MQIDPIEMLHIWPLNVDLVFTHGVWYDYSYESGETCCHQNKWATPPNRTLNRWDGKRGHTWHFRAVLISLQWFCSGMKLFLLPRVAPTGSSLYKKVLLWHKKLGISSVPMCWEAVGGGVLQLELKYTLYVCDRLFNSNCNHLPICPPLSPHLLTGAQR